MKQATTCMIVEQEGTEETEGGSDKELWRDPLPSSSVVEYARIPDSLDRCMREQDERKPSFAFFA